MKQLILYLVFLFSAVYTTCSAQITAIHFNADWNKQNNVEWFNKLGDCDKQSLFKKISSRFKFYYGHNKKRNTRLY